MKHGAVLLVAALLPACGGFTEPAGLSSSFIGRVLDGGGEPVANVGIYLVQDHRATVRAATAPDGRFVVSATPNERYTVVVHDGEGQGYVLADTNSDFVPTDLGDLTLASLRRWPGLVLIDGIGYDRRITDIPGGLSYDSLGYAGALTRLVAADEDGGRGALYRFDTETGTITLIHEDIVDDGDIVNEWLGVLAESGPPRTDIFRRLTDGRELHRVPAPARVLYLDDSALWLVEPVEFDVDLSGSAASVFDWRITRIGSDGARRKGPLLFGTSDRTPRNVCLPTFGQAPIWGEADETGLCLRGSLREVDLDTLVSEPTPDALHLFRGRSFFFGGKTFTLRLNPGAELTSRGPSQDEPQVEAWFDCPQCGDDLLNPTVVGEVIVIAVERASLEVEFRISDLRLQQHRWIGPSVRVDGQQSELFADAVTGVGPYGVVAEQLVLLSTPARTPAGAQTWALDMTPAGEIREELLIPFASCSQVSASPSGRWFLALERSPTGACIERVRRRADRGAPFRAVDFVRAAGISYFVDDDEALVRLALDPLTGTQQLFRFELPEDRS